MTDRPKYTDSLTEEERVLVQNQGRKLFLNQVPVEWETETNGEN